MTTNEKRPIGADPSAGDTERALNTDQALSDTHQALSDTDQALSDTDQALSDTDQTLSDAEQSSEDASQVRSDRDQVAADRDHASRPPRSETDESSYQQSRDERAATSHQRQIAGRQRSARSRQRGSVAQDRDETADERDEASASRLPPAAQPASVREAALLAELEIARTTAAKEHARAASERLNRAKDRRDAARERARLEAELQSAHLDHLTGAFRREMGPTAISNEIARMGRSGGSMVVAFVDVDGLKPINDNQGHDAGDNVLRTVVRVMQAHLRPYDSIIRYGGDEFVCVLSDVDIAQAEHRFVSIAAAIEAQAGVTVSFGFATQEDGDTPESIVNRADADMIDMKRNHYSASTGPQGPAIRR